MYQCSRCLFQTAKRSELIKHKAEGHRTTGGETGGEKAPNLTDLFQCEVCQFSTRSAGSFRQHRYTHEDPKFFCDQCEYATTRRYHLKRHLQAVHEGVKHPCDQCSFQASDSSVLVQHRKSLHEYVRYRCGECEFTAKSPAHVRKHRKCEHEGLRYSCSVCGYKAGL